MPFRKEKILRIAKFAAAPVIGILILSWAIVVLISKIKGISAGDVLHQISLVHTWKIFFAIGLTFLNFCVLTGYDYFGLRYAGIRLPFKKIILAAIVGDSLNSNLGLNILVGSSVKLRFYTSWGIKVSKIIKTIAVYSIGGYWNGFFFLTGLSLLWAPSRFLPSFMPGSYWRIVGTLCLISNVIWLLNVIFNKKNIKIGKIVIQMPGPSVAFPLFLVSCLDWAIAASILFVLLPDQSGIAWHQLLAVYLIAHFAGMMSQVPGGIAVFESIVFILVSNKALTPSLTASLALFRVIFYFLPLVVATTLFLIFEFNTNRKLFRK
jgi:glycosyltransferase 2 family protein